MDINKGICTFPMKKKNVYATTGIHLKWNLL